MGSPIAPLLADVCMNWIFDQASPLSDQNTVLIRYVDDMFLILLIKQFLTTFFALFLAFILARSFRRK